MTLVEAKQKAARMSKASGGCLMYVVTELDGYEVMNEVEWSGYGYTEGETVAVYENGEPA